MRPDFDFLCFRVGAPLIGGIEQTLNRERANSQQQCLAAVSPLHSQHSTVPQNYSAASGKNIFSTSTIIPLKVLSALSLHFRRRGQCVCGSNTIFKTPRPSFRHKSRDRVAFHLNQKPFRTITRLKLFLNSRDRPKSSLKIVYSIGSGRNVVFLLARY